MHKCKKCGKCCISSNFHGVVIYPSDVERISNGLNISPSEFLNKYCIKEYLENNTKIYFLNNKTERCMFLTDNNLCLIHDFKPIQCKKAPLHYFSKKSIWINMPCLKNIEIDENLSVDEDRLLVYELLSGYDD